MIGAASNGSGQTHEANAEYNEHDSQIDVTVNVAHWHHARTGQQQPCTVTHKHTYTFLQQQQNASRVFAIVWASVCPSVTLVISIKTVQARITKSSLWAAPRSLVYRDKISCHWVQGFPTNEGVEEGYPLKRRHFAVIGSNNVKTVADRYIHAAYHNKHWWQAFWIHEHWWPWTTLNLSKRVF